MSVQNSKFSIGWMFNKLPLLVLTITVLFTSCQKEATLDLEENTNLRQNNYVEAGEKLKALMAKGKLQSKFDRLVRAKQRASKARTQIGAIEELHPALQEVYEEHQHLMDQVINPDDYECGPTFINSYLASRIRNFTSDDIFFISNFGIIAFYEGILFDGTDDKDYFGIDGDFTSIMRKSFINLKTFWDIPTDIQLSDAHGTVFKNVPIVAAIIRLVFVNFDENGNPTPITEEESIEFAELLKEVFSAPVFEDYNHPLFTFNALALGGIPSLGIGKKIVMGDGLMEAYAELGYRTVADRFILAHEYGHHIQFANDYFEGGPATPEGTRRTELMADAYAAYFMAHGKGAFLQPLLTKRFVKSSHSIGDCAFDDSGHHGTPNQRAAAAELGSKLAKRRGLKDPVYSSHEFFELFEAALPDLIAPDAH